MKCIVTHAGLPCILLTLPDSGIMYWYNVSKQDINTHTCIVYHGMSTALWTCMHLTAHMHRKHHDGEDNDVKLHVVCLSIASLGKDLSSSIMQSLQARCIICDRRSGPYLCHLSA